MEKSKFSDSWIEDSEFIDVSLEEADFKKSVMISIKMIDCSLLNADFRNIDEKNISLIIEDSEGNPLNLKGIEALAWLKSQEAITDEIPNRYLIKYHPSFNIVDKLVRKLSEKASRQKRGLLQRGVSRSNPIVAEKFINHLLSSGIIEIDKSRKDLIKPTETGRTIITQYLEGKTIPSEIENFFNEE